MDKVYNISCSWKLDTKPDSVSLDGKWAGQFICKDNKIIGVAYQRDNNSRFLIIGSFNEDKGIVLTKISTEKKFDTTSFTLFKKGNSFTGTFAIESQFGSNVIGTSQAEINQASIFVADTNDLEMQYREAKKAIQSMNGLGNYLLKDIEKPSQIAQREKLLGLNTSKAGL